MKEVGLKPGVKERWSYEEETNDHGDVCTADGTTVSRVATRLTQLSQKPALPPGTSRKNLHVKEMRGK